MYEGRYAYEIVEVVEVTVEVVEVIVEVLGVIEVIEVSLLSVEISKSPSLSEWSLTDFSTIVAKVKVMD